jgi:hypothetical protein
MANAKPATKAINQTLTEKEQAFLEFYLIHWNAKKAALLAGYCVDHPRNAMMAGYEILHKPYIRAAIDERMQTMCMEANEVLARLATIARADITDYMTESPTAPGEWFVDIEKLKEDGLGWLIKSYEPNRLGGFAKVEFYSAMDALDRIAKHLNLLKQPDTEVNVSLSAWSVFVQSAKEAATTRTGPGSAFINSTEQRTLSNALSGPSHENAASRQIIDALPEGSDD